jgi:hypothetical protein
MEAVWSAQLFDDSYFERRTCRERSSPESPECGVRMVRIRDREFRWQHRCSGLLHGIDIVYTALVHGSWRNAMSLEALDQYAAAMQPPQHAAQADDNAQAMPAPPPAASADGNIAEVIELADRRVA